MAYGKVVQIIGPVIDCEFGKNEIPKINEAIRIMRKTPTVSTDDAVVPSDQDVIESDSDVYAEVLQQRGSGVVRCVSFNATEGLTRGLVCESLGSSIKVPVGENITGRRQSNPIIAADQPWSQLFDPTMVWGPVSGAMAYLGIRINLFR